MSMIQVSNVEQTVVMDSAAATNAAGNWIVNKFLGLSKAKRFLVAVFVVWFLQAVPKWAAVIFASDELSSQIMQMFITPGL
jgi:hypothetical protein